jgi:hypothetical protein
VQNKIFIAVPSYNGIQAMTMGTILQILSATGCPAKLSLYPDCALITLARSELLGKFLRSDCTHLFFIDADVSFDPFLIGRMLDTGIDVVTGVYCSRKPPYKLNLNRMAPPHITETPAGEQLLEIHSTGLGCTLVSRKAIEETCKLNPDLEYISERDHEPTFALFMETISASPVDGVKRFMGEDIMFFWRLRDAGFPAFAVINATITHDGKDFCLADELIKEAKEEDSPQKPIKKTRKKKSRK